MERFWPVVEGVTLALIGLAVIAVVFAPGATTGSVIGSYFSGLSGVITAATSPISGGTSTGHA